MHTWRKHANGKDPYGYPVLRAAFPWARTWRAGIIIKNGDNVLVVHQRPGDREVRGKWGFPKGAREPRDRCARDTAIRETREETGINISPKDLSPAVFVIPRRATSEVFIYFLHCAKTRPHVDLCDRELCGYSWPVIDNVRVQYKVSEPTILLLQTLEKFDIRS